MAVTFSPSASQEVAHAIQAKEKKSSPEEAKITVNDTISRVAFLYEKIRNVVDYKDEHLIRKAAIGRIMKRHLFLESDPHVVAERLVRELISARYLPNRVLPESIVSDVAERVQKYQVVLRTGLSKHMTQWLRGVIAVEIEELLAEPVQEKALVTFLYQRLADRVVLTRPLLDQTELRLQVYIACYRTMVKADDEMLAFKLLRASLPEWVKPQQWWDAPKLVAERLCTSEKTITARLSHPYSQRFIRAVRPWAVSLGMLRDVLVEESGDLSKLLGKPESVIKKVEARAEERYTLAKKRLRRGTFRATIYLLLTKMIIAVLVEVPLEVLWYREFSMTSLVINLSFPPVLMFLVGLLIRVPSGDNTARIAKGVEELLGESPVPIREIKEPKERSITRQIAFGLSYALTFLISFGGVLLILAAMNFTWVSSVIFIFFLCLVSFFAFRLRLNAREVVIVEGRDRFTTLFMDFISLPILRAGLWLSQTISHMNIFLFFFDFLFEAPFKLFLSILEEWFVFLKEKKEELL